MTTTAAEIRAYAPEYAGLTDEQIGSALTDAVAEVDPAVWGDKADAATKALAAHKLSVSFPVIRGGEKDGERYLQEFERIRGGLSLTPLVL
jgi:hypothetical protein